MASEALRIRDVDTYYGDSHVLHGVGFALAAGRLLGLLGRNGAGKTTIMRLLAGHEVPSSGAVRVLSADPFENERVLSQITFVREAQSYPDMRVGEVLRVAAAGRCARFRAR